MSLPSAPSTRPYGVREAMEPVWLWNGKRGGGLSIRVVVVSALECEKRLNLFGSGMESVVVAFLLLSLWRHIIARQHKPRRKDGHDLLKYGFWYNGTPTHEMKHIRKTEERWKAGVSTMRRRGKHGVSQG